MKKLILALMATAALAGAASATTFNVHNETENVAVNLSTYDNGSIEHIRLDPKESQFNIQTGELNLQVEYAGYGNNRYGSAGDNSVYDIHVWGAGLGNYTITIDKLN